LTGLRARMRQKSWIEAPEAEHTGIAGSNP
jgi:hypothetical protein